VSAVATWALLVIAMAAPPASTCFGTPARGRLEGGVVLPVAGPNFEAYSRLGAALNRTFVHPAVRDTVVAAYARVAAQDASRRFIYGETGARDGGPFPPHRTHQNGLSVDFMVPLMDAKGGSRPLPTPPPWFGYKQTVTPQGRLGALRVDFKAMALHLGALRAEASARGLTLRRVIFDPTLRRRLQAQQDVSGLRFSRRPAWVRHDEHYHVDFERPCAPLVQALP
jgi:penicillin-insensitive murein DD-endopeptidase